MLNLHMQDGPVVHSPTVMVIGTRSDHAMVPIVEFVMSYSVYLQERNRCESNTIEIGKSRRSLAQSHGGISKCCIVHFLGERVGWW